MRPKYTLLTDSQWKSIEKLLTDKGKRKYRLRTIKFAKSLPGTTAPCLIVFENVPGIL